MNWQENTTLSVPVVEGDSVGRVRAVLIQLFEPMTIQKNGDNEDGDNADGR